MQRPIPAMSPSEPDPAILEKLESFEWVCLIPAAGIAIFFLLVTLIPILQKSLPAAWCHMTAESAVCTLLAIASLRLRNARNSQRSRQISLLLAGLVALVAGLSLVTYTAHHSLGLEFLFPPYTGAASGILRRMSPQAAGSFALLGITLLVLRVRKGPGSYLADTLTSLLGLLVLTIVSGYIFGASRLFGISVNVEVTPQALICLALLTLVTVLRRAENGYFSILLGRGIGSRIARILFPLMLVLPLIREVMRARLIARGWLPAHYATAILASTAVLVAEFLIFFLAWRIRDMEMEIHDLTLRDALTGLYNLRGFYLLADQALRLAHRSGEPFTVIFVDLDNLKHINDSLGHEAGSQFLVDTANILKDTFRETDVLGRVGGDEFAVAGQFSAEAVLHAEERLAAAAERRSAESGRNLALGFSVGHATSSETLHDTLDQLLTRADHAMYQQKRAKKSGAA